MNWRIAIPSYKRSTPPYPKVTASNDTNQMNTTKDSMMYAASKDGKDYNKKYNRKPCRPRRQANAVSLARYWLRSCMAAELADTNLDSFLGLTRWLDGAPAIFNDTGMSHYDLHTQVFYILYHAKKCGAASTFLNDWEVSVDEMGHPTIVKAVEGVVMSGIHDPEATPPKFLIQLSIGIHGEPTWEISMD